MIRNEFALKANVRVLASTPDSVIKTQGQAHSLPQSGVRFHRCFSRRVEWFMSWFVRFTVHLYILTSVEKSVMKSHYYQVWLKGMTHTDSAAFFALLGDVGFVVAMGLRYRMTFIDEVNPDAVQKRSESCPPVMRPNYNFQDFLPRTFGNKAILFWFVSNSCGRVFVRWFLPRTDRTAGIELLFQHQQQQYHLQVRDMWSKTVKKRRNCWRVYNPWN